VFVDDFYGHIVIDVFMSST